MVGVRQNRSIQDEKLLAAIFSTTRNDRPLSAIQSAPTFDKEGSGSSQEEPLAKDTEAPMTNAEEMEDQVIAKLRGDNNPTDKDKPLVYGAQQSNLIVDARPTVNAFAMQAVGLGSENMDNYKFATKAYLGIDNIHVMRDSLNKVIETLKDSDLTPLPPNRDALAKSNWLKHLGNMLDGVGLITRQVGLHHSHVLIHCSDGWDRTSQLSALSQICLDPYFRTIDGFIVLVEKDWLSFGHMFRYRSGHLSSEKWFHIENERIGGKADTERNRGNTGSDPLTGAGKAFENAFLSAKGFFNRDSAANASRESLVDSDQDVNDPDQSPRRSATASPSARSRAASTEKEITKVKETAPIFHQFLDAVYQLMYQYPTRFEFNERFLRRLLYHLYSCQYGTFLYDNEKSRKEARAAERTRSVWDYFLSRREQFLNPKYDSGAVDDRVSGRERLIFPRPEEVRWWNEVFGRTDAEMNGPATSAFNGTTSINHRNDMSIDSEPVEISASGSTSTSTSFNFSAQPEKPEPSRQDRVEVVPAIEKPSSKPPPASFAPTATAADHSSCITSTPASIPSSPKQPASPTHQNHSFSFEQKPSSAPTTSAPPPQQPHHPDMDPLGVSVLTGVETANASVGPAAQPKGVGEQAKEGVAALAAGIGGLGFKRGDRTGVVGSGDKANDQSKAKNGGDLRETVELEMQ